MNNSKNIVIFVIVTVILLIGATVVISVVKPKMHETFNIQKLIIKKEVKK